MHGPSVTLVAKQVKVDTVVNGTDASSVATSTRFQEVKAEMSDHFEAKLAAANNRIEHLAGIIDNMRSEQEVVAKKTSSDLSILRDEQAFARQKITETESSVVQSGQQMLQAMQSMMNQMQNGLEANVKQWLNHPDDNKRRLTDAPAREDAFCAKS